MSPIRVCAYFLFWPRAAAHGDNPAPLFAGQRLALGGCLSNETALNLIDRQLWLDPLGDRLQDAVHGAYESGGETGQSVKNALHGTWLGHPLHAVLTDIPVGAWTAAAVFDALEEMTGQRRFAAASDLAVTVGLVGAIGSAITGITDWSDTDGRARKAGLIHGMLNLGGTLLYGASLLHRSRNQRKLGRGFGLLGFAMAAASAYLGGELVYSEQVGVNHAAGLPLPEDFVPVAADADIGEGRMRKVEAAGVPVLLARVDGQLCAIQETCSHAGGPLFEGTLEGTTVTCPWHGSSFDVRTGKVINGPATHPAPCFETRVRDGQIEIRKARG